MNDTKYIGLDVHQATITAAVRDATGKLVMEAIRNPSLAQILIRFRPKAEQSIVLIGLPFLRRESRA
jgi:hypothetical protein